MIEDLISFIDKLKRNPNLPKFDEASTKQAIILPILRLLKWDTDDIDEVKPELLVEDKRVDYSLRVNNTDKVFIEAKPARDSLEGHEEQLLGYTYRHGPEIAALTNGVTWSLYLPPKGGDWKPRKFYTIDIIQQESMVAAQKLIDLLFKENVRSGDALRNAESIYKDRLKKGKIEEALPQAWGKIVSEPAPPLIDLIAETTEKVCGFKPEPEDTIQFLKRYEQQIVISSEVLPTPTRVRPRIVKTQTPPGVRRRQKASRVTLQELVDARLIQDGQDLYFYYTQLFKGEKATVMARENKLKYTSDGNFYSVSQLATILLKNHGFRRGVHLEAGPRYWKTYDGRSLNDLNEEIRRGRGDRS